MMCRCLIALIALTAVALYSGAAPGRRRAQPTYQYQPARNYQPAPAPAPAPVTYTANYTPADPAAVSIVAASGVEGDGLDEVNAHRAARGLRPFVRDEALTQAARGCAAFRAQHRLFGHTSNDFAFVPAGAVARSAGCAAYPASYGWMSCCVYDNYTYGGAAYVTGADGKRYMHLFVR